MPYDPTWPARYRRLADQLRAALGSRWQVEHIGSTSVPGLLAKPVIDVAVRIPHSQKLRDELVVLEGARWTNYTVLPTHEALYQLDQSGVRRAIAHFFLAERWSTAPQRLFPAWLRTHPADRDAYADLKQSLRAGGTWGHAYTAAKANFVREISAKAAASTI